MALRRSCRQADFSPRRGCDRGLIARRAFDRDGKANFCLPRKRRIRVARIVHAGGDGSGREIMRVLTELARETPSITVIERIARGG